MLRVPAAAWAAHGGVSPVLPALFPLGTRRVQSAAPGSFGPCRAPLIPEQPRRAQEYPEPY